LLHTQGLVSVLQSLHDDLDAAVLQAYGWADLGPVPWRDDAAREAWTETLLTRLVALNTRRASEEAAGTVRWLRPDFQDPARRAAAQAAAAAARAGADAGTDAGMDAGVDAPATAAAAAPPAAPQQAQIEGLAPAAAAAQPADDSSPDSPDPAALDASTAGTAPAAQAWPATLPEQVRVVAQLLAASPVPLALPAIEAAFKGKGPCKKGLPRILDALEAVGRAQRVGALWRG
jgi:hypothetical protein